MKEGKKFRECLKHDATGVSPECRSIQLNFFDCKRSLVCLSKPDLTHILFNSVVLIWL